MIRLEEKYEQAVQFRKRGFTYSEIAKIVDVSKSTVSVWLSKKAFSKQVKADNLKRAAKDNVKRIRLINKARKAERTVRYEEAVRSAETEYRHYKKDPLFIAGLVTYISSNNTTESLRIRASSPSFVVHRIMVHFFTMYLGVHKEKIHFLLHSPQKSNKRLIQLWSRKIGLPIEQFYKTQFVHEKVEKKINSGSGTILCNDAVLKKKLLRWMELFEKDVYK